ncbi:MAG TPA: hypothetical protein VGA13_12540 [Acidimicrobiales bacterium]|jgi:hypothetical protein
MLLWFVGLAPAIVWNVFGDPAIDIRLIVTGALAPDAVDLVVGGAHSHTLAAPAALLAVTMVATTGRRQLRRRLLALPIGALLHLVLDGAWTDETVFWWPFLGGDLASAEIPTANRALPLLAAMEVAGAIAVVWFVRRFRLVERQRRVMFIQTGRVGRDLVDGPPSWR